MMVRGMARAGVADDDATEHGAPTTGLTVSGIVNGGRMTGRESIVSVVVYHDVARRGMVWDDVA